MKRLKGFQKKYLRGLAHAKKPVVFVGQKGLTPALTEAVEEALNTHELIKVKFNEFKEKEQKAKIAELIETDTGAELVGIIGHTAIFYRCQKDPAKRKIDMPAK